MLLHALDALGQWQRPVARVCWPFAINYGSPHGGVVSSAVFVHVS
jgi:hypothetical protein